MTAYGAASRSLMAGLLLAAVAIGAMAGNAAESLTFTCLDEATRAPVAGVKIAATVDTTLAYYVTDERGVCEIPFPEGGPRSLAALTLNAEGYVPVAVEWRAGSRPIPDEHTVFLEPGTVIGGTIVDSHEKPVPNALVRITLPVTEEDGVQVLVRDHTETTDEHGRWQCGILPDALTIVNLRVEVDKLSVQQNFRYGAAGRPLEALRDLSDRIVLEERCNVYGGVVAPDGRPIAGASVSVWLTNASWRTARLAKTDGWGRFQVTGCEPGHSAFLVRAPGWAPLLEHGDVQIGGPSRMFTLEQGVQLRLRVVDAAGEPLAGAWVAVDAWRGLEGLLEWQAFTDESGEAVWPNAPSEGISLMAEAAGAQPATLQIPRIKDDVYTIRIGSAIRIRGRVFEENGDLPVAVFEVIPGIRYQEQETIRWMPSWRFEGARGAFSFTLPRSEETINCLKITAPGKAPWISPEIPSDKDEFELVAHLTSAAPLRGRVVDATGKALGGASVYMCTPSVGLYLHNGRLASEFFGTATETGSDGVFELSPELPPFSIVVVSEGGYAFVSSGEWTSGAEVVVHPWAVLRGHARYGEEVLGNHSFRAALYVKEDGIPIPFFEYQAKTDRQGNFEIDHLPPMECCAMFDFAMRDGSAFQWPVEGLALQSESPPAARIGGTGQAVRGSVPLPDEPTTTPQPPVLCILRQIPPGGGCGTPAFQAYTAVRADGGFHFPDVPPGSYVASVNLPRASSEEEERTEFDRLEVEFAVAAPEEGQAPEEIDLGEMIPPERVTLAVKEPVPPFEARLVDGTPVALGDYAGRFLLVDVWATWCGPCHGDTPFLKKVYDEFGDDPRFAMLGISLDSEKDALMAYIEREKIPWPQIFAPEIPGFDITSMWGIEGIPAILLIGPDGTLAAQHLRGEAIAVAVRQALRYSDDTMGENDEQP
ncbi:MAG: redoxin domain-containing protein [Candidatus Hydrogenedentes bacterium]|nr:redoxin domain-containing protein [Candidatus Hydrogenedentota bacterium]